MPILWSQTTLASDKHIQIKYNTEDEYTNIGDPINYIHDMVVRPEDWHLLVLYNDPEHRATEQDLNEEGKDSFGNIWVNGITGSRGTQYGNSIYWRDYGTIKDQAGVLIGFNVSEQEVIDADKANILDYLNDTYPLGLTGDQNELGGNSTRGKIVTFNYLDKDDKEFYAFDYNKYEWYYLGTFQDSGMRDARLANMTTDKTKMKDIIATINVNGILFTSIEATYSLDAIPSYWDKGYNTWN